MFCLEIARRSVRNIKKIENISFFVDHAEDPYVHVPIINNQKDQFKGLDIIGSIVSELNSDRLPDSKLFGCFTGNNRKNFLKDFLKAKDLSKLELGELKKAFLNKKITDRILSITELSDFFKNSIILKKLKKQNFTYWEPIDKLNSSMLDLANFNLNITVEKIVEIIKSIDFSRLEFKASDANDEDSIYKDTLKS